MFEVVQQQKEIISENYAGVEIACGNWVDWGGTWLDFLKCH